MFRGKKKKKKNLKAEGKSSPAFCTRSGPRQKAWSKRVSINKGMQHTDNGKGSQIRYGSEVSASVSDNPLWVPPSTTRWQWIKLSLSLLWFYISPYSLCTCTLENASYQYDCAIIRTELINSQATQVLFNLQTSMSFCFIDINMQEPSNTYYSQRINHLGSKGPLQMCDLNSCLKQGQFWSYLQFCR